MLQQDVEACVKSCNVCLTSKAICHKPYKDLQLLPIPIYWWKDLLIDCIIGLRISANWKDNSYDLILVIVDRLTKMVDYVPVQVTINAPGLAEVIINVVVCYHRFPESIMTDQSSFFTSKFWFLLYYFLVIKKKLSTAFHSQINGQMEK